MVLYALQHTPTYLAIKHSKDTNQSELPHWKGHLASMSDHPKRNAKSAPQTAHDNMLKKTECISNHPGKAEKVYVPKQKKSPTRTIKI